MKLASVIRYCLLGMLIYLLGAGYSLADTEQFKEVEPEDTNGILVTFRDDVTTRQAKQIIDKADGTVEETLNPAGEETLVVSLETQKAQAVAIRQLERNPEVESVQPNYVYTMDQAAATRDPGT